MITGATQRRPSTIKKSICSRGNGRKWKITNRVKTKTGDELFVIGIDSESLVIRKVNLKRPLK